MQLQQHQEMDDRVAVWRVEARDGGGGRSGNKAIHITCRRAFVSTNVGRYRVGVVDQGEMCHHQGCGGRAALPVSEAFPRCVYGRTACQAG